MIKSITASLPRVLPARVLSVGLAVAMGFAFALPASARVVIRVHFAPPPLLVYQQPMIPAPGYLWVPGYWAWDEDVGDYYWIPGQWVMPPFAGALWTPGYWAWDNGYYYFNDGYWGPAVGYYGGIDYGYGYFGVDYVGGYWASGIFNYNRAYNRIDNRIVHVYDRTTIINRTVINNRVSYNGGPGGVDIRPTPHQRRIDGERRWDAVPAQREAMRESRERRDNHYGNNRATGDGPRWRGRPSATPPAPPSAATLPSAPTAGTQRPTQPPHGRDGMRWQPPRDMMPTVGTTDQPTQQPRQWEGARLRMPLPDRAAREERRPMERPPMPSPELRPRPVPQQPQAYQQPRPAMQPRPQPMPAYVPPASHPAPAAQAQRSGNPHRDDHRRDKDDN